jgi:hypothetical protein
MKRASLSIHSDYSPVKYRRRVVAVEIGRGGNVGAVFDVGDVDHVIVRTICSRRRYKTLSSASHFPPK